MKVYLIWAINLPEETDTKDRDRYLEKFPHAAQYLPFHLFPANYDEVANLTCNIVDLSGKALVETEEEKLTESDLTYAEFDALADQLIGQGFSGRCIVLSVAQGRYLHQTRYNES